MKRNIFFLLIPLLFSVLISCTNEVNSPVNKDQSFMILGSVSDGPGEDYTPIYYGGVAVIMDDRDTSITGDNGRYGFIKVPQGEHTLKVFVNNCEPYIQPIFISRDININIYLKGIIADYFPIQKNFTKKFRYKSSGTINNYSYTEDGEAVWRILDAKQNGEDIEFEALETLVFQRKISDSSNTEIKDTSETYFTIIERKDKSIFFNMSILNGVTFKRFMDSRRGEVISISHDNTPSVNVSLKRNTGIYKIQETEFKNSKVYELIE